MTVADEPNLRLAPSTWPPQIDIVVAVQRALAILAATAEPSITTALISARTARESGTSTSDDNMRLSVYHRPPQSEQRNNIPQMDEVIALLLPGAFPLDIQSQTTLQLISRVREVALFILYFTGTTTRHYNPPANEVEAVWLGQLRAWRALGRGNALPLEAAGDEQAHNGQ